MVKKRWLKNGKAGGRPKYDSALKDGRGRRSSRVAVGTDIVQGCHLVSIVKQFSKALM